MTETSNIRRERIEKLLYELRYEIERGMIEHEIEEHLTFQFIVPISSAIKDGVVFCEFRTEPMPRFYIVGRDQTIEPRLKVIKGDKP